MTAPHQESAAPMGNNPGETLRIAREDKGWPLSAVAQQLNLTERSLARIEAGDFSQLPGHTFARGYVRAYANFPDPADRASQEEEFSLELRARDRERKLIKKIDETLQLIEDNEYGWCDSCGVEIGIRRLEARPTATLCIDCKTLAEIKEKQIGS